MVMLRMYGKTTRALVFFSTLVGRVSPVWWCRLWTSTIQKYVILLLPVNSVHESWPTMVWEKSYHHLPMLFSRIPETNRGRHSGLVWALYWLSVKCTTHAITLAGTLALIWLTFAWGSWTFNFCNLSHSFICCRLSDTCTLKWIPVSIEQTWSHKQSSQAVYELFLPEIKRRGI